MASKLLGSLLIDHTQCFMHLHISHTCDHSGKDYTLLITLDPECSFCRLDKHIFGQTVGIL